MNTIKFLAGMLITAGTLGLSYGGFSYTRKTHEANLGPLELALREKHKVIIPIWSGIGALAIGGGLLLFGGMKNSH